LFGQCESCCYTADSKRWSSQCNSSIRFRRSSYSQRSASVAPPYVSFSMELICSWMSSVSSCRTRCGYPEHAVAIKHPELKLPRCPGQFHTLHAVLPAPQVCATCLPHSFALFIFLYRASQSSLPDFARCQTTPLSRVKLLPFSKEGMASKIVELLATIWAQEGGSARMHQTSRASSKTAH
jgi:hypothetical protein